jgi:hypothetical protein
LQIASKNPDTQCKAIAKNGKPCRAAATAGGLCFFHANPNKASELGRIGGRGNRRKALENLETPLKVDTALAVRDTVASLIARLLAGDLPPKCVSGLASLLSLQLRAVETANVEQRLEKVEKSVAVLIEEREERRSDGVKASDSAALEIEAVKAYRSLDGQ